MLVVLLYIVGALEIGGGVLAGVSIWSEAQQARFNDPFNLAAGARITALAIGIGGVVTGLLTIGFGRVIDLLARIDRNTGGSGKQAELASQRARDPRL